MRALMALRVVDTSRQLHKGCRVRELCLLLTSMAPHWGAMKNLGGNLDVCFHMSPACPWHCDLNMGLLYEQQLGIRIPVLPG